MDKSHSFGYTVVFEQGKYWGMSTQVDLERCDKALIKNRVALKAWIKQLLKKIDMKGVGEPMIELAGTEPHLEGYSLLQLIETSSITAHFCDESGDVYIDIFSCKEYDPAQAANFCADWFRAEKCKWRCNLRGKGKRE